MKIIFILLFIVLCLLFLLTRREGFSTIASEVHLDAHFVDKYTVFSTVYNTFQANWLQAITQSYAVDTGNKTGSTEDMNAYITRLATKEKTSFPPLTDPLPSIQTTDDLLAIQDKIPQDAVPFQHALDWMNRNLKETQAKLESSLKGIQGFKDFQGFADFKESFADICQQITTCQQQQSAQQVQRAVSLQQQLDPVFDSFLQLQPMLDTNTDLIKKSKEIQDKAQNGSLLPPAIPRPSPYTLPSGSNNLKEMQKNDPAKYAEYKQNYGTFMNMKNMFDEINANLR